MDLKPSLAQLMGCAAEGQSTFIQELHVKYDLVFTKSSFLQPEIIGKRLLAELSSNEILNNTCILMGDEDVL